MSSQAFTCCGCGRRLTGRIYAARNAPGDGYCSACYKRLPKVPCRRCGQLHHTQPRDGFVCHSCRLRERHCAHCGRKTTRDTRIVDGKPTCPSCFHRLRSRRPCILCGRTVRDTADWPEGHPVCDECKTTLPAPRRCNHCGTDSRFVRDYPEAGIRKPICLRCRRRARVTCAKCLKHRRPDGLDERGRPICGACRDRKEPFVCPRCGKEGIPHSKARCLDCYWSDYLDRHMKEFASKLQPWVGELYVEFVRELAARKSSNYVVQHRQTGMSFFRAINTIFASPAELTSWRLLKHLGPDGLRRHSTGYDFLVRTGRIIPLTNKEIEDERYRRACRNILDDVQGTWYEGALRKFHDHIERRNRTYREHGHTGDMERYPPMTSEKALKAASVFLKHVDGMGALDVRQINEQHIDSFLREFPSYRDALRTFIRYLNRHGKMFVRLDVPTINRNRGNLILSVPQIRDLAAKVQKDTNVKRALIVSMMLFYAQSARKIVTLKTTDVHRLENGRHAIRFAEVELELVEHVDRLMGEYLRQRTTPSLLDDPKSNPWLFPGRRAGLHLSPEAVTSMLKHYGVTAKRLFATSIHSYFAGGVRHPKVLVRALGITVECAQSYFDLTNTRPKVEAEWLGLRDEWE